MSNGIENALKRQLGDIHPIHSKILGSEYLKEFEVKARTSPISLSILVDRTKELLNLENIKKVQDSIEKCVSEGTKPNEDDEKIIDFFSNLPRKKIDSIFLISGNIIHLEEVFSELQQIKEMKLRNIEVSVLLWTYLNSYESLLAIFTKDLEEYFGGFTTRDWDEKTSKMNEKEKNQFKSFAGLIKTRIEKKQHLEAEKLEYLLIGLGVIKPDSNSILSAKDRTLRNKIGHSTLFYDSGIDKIVSNEGKIYSMDDLLAEFIRLHDFECNLIYQQNGKKSDILGTMNKILSKFERQLKIIERSGHRPEYYIAVGQTMGD